MSNTKVNVSILLGREVQPKHLVVVFPLLSNSMCSYISIRQHILWSQ